MFAGANLLYKDSPELEFREVVQSALRGALVSQQLIYESFYEFVVNFVFRRIGNYHDAEDLAQETFIRAFRSLDSLRVPNTLPYWLCAIARNQMISAERRRQSRVEGHCVAQLRDDADADPAAVDPAEAAETRDDMRQVRRSTRRLTLDDRNVIEVYFIRDLSGQETAFVLDDSEANVKRRAHYAVKRLRRFMGVNRRQEW